MTTSSTPDDLIPRIGELPISNARYFRTAAVTRVPGLAGASQVASMWLARGPMTPGGRPAVTAMAFGPDGSRLVTADESGAVRVRDSAGSTVLGPLAGHTAAVVALAVDPTGATLASADAAGTVRLWDAASGAPLGEPLPERTSETVGVAFAGDGRLLVGRGGALALLTLDPARGAVEATETLARMTAEPFTAIEVALLPDGPLLAAGGADGTVSFGQGARRARKLRQGSGRHAGAVTAAAFSPDGALVATAGEDGSVRLWDPRTGEPAGAPGRHDARATALAWSSDGTLLASAGLDGAVRLWDPAAGAAVGPPLTGGGAGFGLVAFAPTGATMVAADVAGVLWSWIDGTRSILGPLQPPPPRAAGAPARAAEGVLLVHEQSWVMQGIALGELLHSLSLAPGEVTQVAVTSHTRSVLQRSVDAASQQEILDRSGSSDAALTESERTSAAETTAESTTATASGGTAQVGAGGLVSGLGFSGGSATTTSTGVTATFSTGVRQIADESNQAVHQRAGEVARLARRRQTASVREVSESDSLELRTRVVANYNHMHALTLQYYEVVQVARLRTRVTDAHRLLFVPMRMIDFADPDEAARALGRYRREIVDAARALGLDGVATCVDLLMIGDPLGLALRTVRIDQVWRRARDAAGALAAAATRLAAARARADRAGDAVLAARDALRPAEEPGLAERAALQRALRTATEESRAADAEAAAAGADVTRLRREVAAARHDRRALAELLDADPAAEAPPVVDAARLDALTARVCRELARHRTELNHGIWMRLDPSVYAGLLEGAAHEGQAVSPTLDPTPVAVAGSYVGLRWHHADPDAARRFRREHVDRAPVLEEAVPLPTGGVFGEAVLGEAVAAEKVDLTRFWNWQDALPPIRPTAIDPIGQTDDDPPPVPTRAEVPAAAVHLGPITFPQPESGIPGLAAAVANPELFRDVSGAATSAALARSAIELSATGASTAATLAGENFRRHLQLQRKVIGALTDAAGDGSRPLDPSLAGGALNAGGGAPADRERAATPTGSPWSAPAGGASGSATAPGDAGKPAPAVPHVEFVEDEPAGGRDPEDTDAG